MAEIFGEIIEILFIILLGAVSGVISNHITGGSITNFLYSFKILQRFMLKKHSESICQVYTNIKKAEKSITKDMKTTENFNVFCLKGGTFCSQYKSKDTNPYKVLHERNSTIIQRYLISDVDNPYIKKRAPEIGVPPEDLRDGINISIRHLEDEHNDFPRNVNYYKHMETVRLRLYIFDENIYLSFQPVNVEGKDCAIQKYHKGSHGYTALEAYFEELWEKYKKIYEGDK
jgi:hypothetical protein